MVLYEILWKKWSDFSRQNNFIDSRKDFDNITVDHVALEAVEGVYTLPAVTSDIVLAATFVKQSTPTAVENATNAAQVIAIYDMLGRQVYNQVNDLATGMYIVVTSEGTQKISIK